MDAASGRVVGRNRLGEMLMELREALLAGHPRASAEASTSGATDKADNSL